MAIRERGEYALKVGDKEYTLCLPLEHLFAVDEYFVEKGSSCAAYFEDMLKIMNTHISGGVVPTQQADIPGTNGSMPTLKNIHAKDLDFILRKGLEGSGTKINVDEYQAIWRLGLYTLFYAMLGFLQLALVGPVTTSAVQDPPAPQKEASG